MIILYSLASVIIVSLISLVGALTLLARPEVLRKSVFILVSLAVGALLGDAFIHIIPEAFAEANNPLQVSLLLIAGMLLFFVLEKVLHWHHHTKEHAEEHPHAMGKMVLVGDGVHNFIDGVIIAGSYMISTEVGLATTLAVVLHEIPQEVGNFGVLIHAGYSKAKALWLNLISALTAILGAMTAILLGNAIQEFALWLLPLTAGGFIYIALSDLIPELQKDVQTSRGVVQFISIILGVAAMAALLTLEG
jgi:zinc and cadmium transporter